MSFQEINGDLIKLAQQGHFDIIVHGCNCFNTMGSGIAKQIREAFPEAWEADQRTKKGSLSKLGLFTSTDCSIEFHTGVGTVDVVDFTIINAYTQYGVAGMFGNDTPVDYIAIKKVFTTLNSLYRGTGLKVGIPLIGAGLAGGDWVKIKGIIKKAGCNLDITVVHFKP